jgi:hypothetical protein
MRAGINLIRSTPELYASSRRLVVGGRPRRNSVTVAVLRTGGGKSARILLMK